MQCPHATTTSTASHSNKIFVVGSRYQSQGTRQESREHCESIKVHTRDLKNKNASILQSVLRIFNNATIATAVVVNGRDESVNACFGCCFGFLFQLRSRNAS